MIGVPAKCVVPAVIKYSEKRVYWLPAWFPGNRVEREVRGFDVVMDILKGAEK